MVPEVYVNLAVPTADMKSAVVAVNFGGKQGLQMAHSLTIWGNLDSAEKRVFFYFVQNAWETSTECVCLCWKGEMIGKYV